MIDNNVDDWRIAVSPSTVLQVGVELVACAVHPIPGNYHFLWSTTHSDGEDVLLNLLCPIV